MDRNFFVYVWRHSKWQQLWILMIVLASFPIYFLALDLPKYIINGPIQGNGFNNSTGTITAFAFSIPMPAALGGGVLKVFDGVAIDQLQALVVFSCVFLLLVCINLAFRFYINMFKGRLGERMLRRLRYELVDRLLRFPIQRFKRIKAPEISSMVKDEVEPLGGFIGDAYVQPVFLAGQAVTVMAFILTQNVWLGLMAIGIVFLQAVVIPRLRRQLLELARQRQLAARQFAGRIGELVDGISEARANDVTNYERSDAAGRLGRIFFIRYHFYYRKFAIKFLNNFFSQMTPFLFYLVGGYFAIRGQLDIGQLVAVIAAYKDLPGPIIRLAEPTRGAIRFNGTAMSELPDAVAGRRIGYVSSQPYFRDASLRECILYSLRFLPSEMASSVSTEDDEVRRQELLEAELSGNTTLPFDVNWIDFAATGARDEGELNTRIVEVLEAVGLLHDVRQLGLRSRLGADADPAVVENLLRCRFALRRKLEEDGELRRLIEPFSIGSYNKQLSISENFLFGTAIDPAFAADDIASNRTVKAVLGENGLDEKIYQIGHNVAATLVEIFADLSPDHPYFERLSFVDFELLPVYKSMLSEKGVESAKTASSTAVVEFMRLAFSYVEPRHRLGLLTPDVTDMLIVARSALRERLGGQAAEAIDFFDAGSYNKAMTIEENILFDRVVYGLADGPERVRKELTLLLEELGMSGLVTNIGTDYTVGTGGRRLNTTQRQRLCRFLGCADERALTRGGLFASEKRQGTKSRDVGLKLCRGRYGDLSARGRGCCTHRGCLAEH